MKKRLGWLLLIVATAAAMGEDLYRKIGNKVIPMNSTDWAVFRDHVKVVGFQGREPVCQRYTTHDKHTTVATRIEGKRGATAVDNTVTNWGDWILLVNCPYTRNLSQGEDVRGPFAAMRVGTHTIQGAIIRHNGQVLFPGALIPIYDYGTPYTPPPRSLTPAERAAAQTLGDKQKAEADAVKLKFDQDQAEAGKDLYQYRLGLRYLKGDGVDKDLVKAREWLKKSADQGNSDAARELSKLPAA